MSSTLWPVAKLWHVIGILEKSERYVYIIEARGDKKVQYELHERL